jgi:hypothetical protein
MGHLLRARRSLTEDLLVTFTLAAYPDQQFHGRVIEIHEAADVRDDEGNTVLVRVAIDDPLPDVRPGATAQAKVLCGTRPLGYALFHEVLETVQRHAAFWLPEGWLDTNVTSGNIALPGPEAQGS